MSKVTLTFEKVVRHQVEIECEEGEIGSRVTCQQAAGYTLIRKNGEKVIGECCKCQTLVLADQNYHWGAWSGLRHRACESEANDG